jgi:hypothetical protein
MSQAVAKGFQVFTTQEVFSPLDVRASGHDRAFFHGEPSILEPDRIMA